MDADKYESDSKLRTIREERKYTYSDIITVSPDKLPNYEQKVCMCVCVYVCVCVCMHACVCAPFRISVNAYVQ